MKKFIHLKRVRIENNEETGATFRMNPMLESARSVDFERLWRETAHLRADSSSSVNSAKTCDHCEHCKAVSANNDFSAFDINHIPVRSSTKNLTPTTFDYSAPVQFVPFRHNSYPNSPMNEHSSVPFLSPYDDRRFQSFPKASLDTSSDQYATAITYEAFMRQQQQQMNFTSSFLTPSPIFDKFPNQQPINFDSNVNANHLVSSNLNIGPKEIECPLPSPVSVLEWSARTEKQQPDDEEQEETQQQEQTEKRTEEQTEAKTKKATKTNRKRGRATNKAKAQTPSIYPCPHESCTRTFSRLSQLRAHERSHLGIRPYVCLWPMCGWKFARSDELTRHFRKHTGVKPFSCRYCGRAFARSDHLTTHMRRHL